MGEAQPAVRSPALGRGGEGRGRRAAARGRGGGPGRGAESGRSRSQQPAGGSARRWRLPGRVRAPCCGVPRVSERARAGRWAEEARPLGAPEGGAEGLGAAGCVGSVGSL